MTKLKPMTLVNADPDDYYPYTTVSRHRDETGWPINDRHALWESWRNLEHAIHAGKIRCEQGYWVDVFLNVAHGTNLGKDDEHSESN